MKAVLNMLHKNGVVYICIYKTYDRLLTLASLTWYLYLKQTENKYKVFENGNNKSI